MVLNSLDGQASKSTLLKKGNSRVDVGLFYSSVFAFGQNYAPEYATDLFELNPLVSNICAVGIAQGGIVFRDSVFDHDSL